MSDFEDKALKFLMFGVCLMVFILLIMIPIVIYQECVSEKIELRKDRWTCSQERRYWAGKTFQTECIQYQRN
jgi:hypothetical protein